MLELEKDKHGYKTLDIGHKLLLFCCIFNVTLSIVHCHHRQQHIMNTLPQILELLLQ